MAGGLYKPLAAKVDQLLAGRDGTSQAITHHFPDQRAHGRGIIPSNSSHALTLQHSVLTWGFDATSTALLHSECRVVQRKRRRKAPQCAALCDARSLHSELGCQTLQTSQRKSSVATRVCSVRLRDC
eukprot:894635-Rhodomonas_salina.2